MSRGTGYIQRRLLSILSQASEPVSTFDLVAGVYDVQPDAAGNYWLTDPQLSSVRRALGTLAKNGAVSGRRGYHDSRQRWATPVAWADVDKRHRRLAEKYARWRVKSDRH